MRMHRWVLSVLFATALIVSGTVYAQDDDGYGGHEGWSRHHGKECAGHHLPEAKMKILHEAMKVSFEKDKALHEEAHKLHEELRKVFTANTFDEKAFVALNTKLEDIHARIQRDHMKAFASALAQFSPEEREELMRKFHRHHHHFGQDASWHHHDGDHGHEWGRDHESGQMDQPFTGVTTSQSRGADNEYPPYPSR